MGEFLFNFTYENALRCLEIQLNIEKSYPTLADQLHIQSNHISVSGLKESDYPAINEFVGGSLKVTKSVLIPILLQEKMKESKENFMMGVFPEISRMWITVDNQLFLWNYDTNAIPEYYEILDTIQAVALVKPKPGVFQQEIHNLICIAGVLDTIVIGVKVSGYRNEEVNFLEEPLFKVATDDERVCVIESIKGRIFLGTHSGSVLELSYWAGSLPWYNLSRQSLYINSQNAFDSTNKVYLKIINHSTWKLSILLPSAIINGLSHSDSIIQIATDVSRNTFYTLSENSLIAQYSLLPKDGLSRVSYITESSIISKISKNVSFIEKNQFKNIIHIAPLSIGYGALKLMAVTQNGIRIYFADDLRLCHVRMPPVSASGLYGKINNVRLCCETRGTLLVVCGSPHDSQALYTINPDSFVYPHELLETVSVNWTNQGGCWALLPLLTSSDKQADSSILAGCPILQTQHLDAGRRFLLVSRDTIFQLQLPSPVQHLRQLLDRQQSATVAVSTSGGVGGRNSNNGEASFNPLATEIRTWMNHFGLDETAYAALLLCVQYRTQDLTQHKLLQTQQVPLAVKAMELVLHCLHESAALQLQQQHNPQDTLVNPLHRLLCTYTARILRPLWDSAMLETASTSGTSGTEQQLQSTHDLELLGYFMSHLRNLHDFVRNNYPRLKAIDSMQFPGQLQPVAYGTGSLALELLELTKVAVEVTGLWRILTEHQFSLIMTHLAPEIRHELLSCAVKHLLLPSKRHLLLGLIAALLQQYLSVRLPLENVIECLLKVCPNIYRLEDALCSQANELLAVIEKMMADNSSVSDIDLYQKKKEDLLIEIVGLYEQIGAKIELGPVIGQLRRVGCMWGAVFLCLHAARLRDPDEIAFLCLRDMRRPHTQIEIAAVEGRNDAYKSMLECLSSLLVETEAQSHSRLLNVPAGNLSGELALVESQPPRQAAGDDLNGISQLFSANQTDYTTTVLSEDLSIILRFIFDRKEDIMAHYEAYSWMMDNGLTSNILRFAGPHLEPYLQQSLQQSPNSVEIKTLLWKHFEMQSRYFEAAKVLDNLAVAESNELNLDDRIGCLSRAIVFLKAIIGEKQFVDLDLLKELEDKLKLTSLQKMIINEVSADNTSIIAELNSRLFNLYSLLKEYVEPLDLTICKLFILKINDKKDMNDIRLVWEHVLEKEFEKAEHFQSLESRMVSIRQGVQHSVGRFKDDVGFIPLDLIIFHVELYSECQRFPDDYTVNTLITTDIPVSTTLIAYNGVIRMKNQELKKIISRIYTSICIGLDLFLNKQRNTKDCQMFGNPILDLITTCLVHLQARPDQHRDFIVDKFKAYQSLLERCL